MATYCSVAEYEGYSVGWTTTDAAALELILQEAERDVDRVLGSVGWDRPAAQVLKVAPAALSARDRAALMRATAAQAEYRIEKGEAFFRQAQYDSVSGPKFSTTGTLPRTGPKVREELEAFSLYPGSAEWSIVTR